MRVWSFVLLLAIGVGASQSRPALKRVAVVIDSDSPVANAEASARVREDALADVERGGHPLFFELNAHAITLVPENARDSFRRTVFTFHSPKYAGVSQSFAEASDILRKNEAVRDAVIQRECRSPTPECGGAVHAAAIALVTDTEIASSRKLRLLVETATSRRLGTLILVTAGWPYRDERRLGLDRAVRELRAAGTSLVVFRVAALFPYSALVKDATEALAWRLSATMMALDDQRDVERARRALVDSDRAATEPSVAVPAGTTERVEPLPVENVSTGFDRSDAVLQRAAAYVAQFERTFSAVIWREHYQQQVHIRRRFNSSGGSFDTVGARRQLDSELLFVWVPSDATWIAVRDVIAIDGKPRSPLNRQLPALLSSSAISVNQLKQLAAENGRFNIGGILRTFNEPTLALLFLDEHYRQRFSFTRTGEQTINDRRAATYNFVERVRPTVIQDRDQDVTARGTLWIDTATSRVLRTSLELSDSSGLLRGRMTVQYRPDPKFDVLVPSEMRETYTSSSGERVTSVATYSDFRRFETDGRVIIRK